MTNRLRLILPSLLALGTLVLSACGATPAATDWFFGDALTMRVREMRFAEEVGYALGDSHYVVRPSREDYVIAAAYLEIRNREGSVTVLRIGKESARLRDTDYYDYQPINPFQQREGVEQAVANEGALLPLIWADGSGEAPIVELPERCGEEPACELKGWMLFEVPRGTKFYQFIWEASDAIYLRF